MNVCPDTGCQQGALPCICKVPSGASISEIDCVIFLPHPSIIHNSYPSYHSIL